MKNLIIFSIILIFGDINAYTITGKYIYCTNYSQTFGNVFHCEMLLLKEDSTFHYEEYHGRGYIKNENDLINTEKYIDGKWTIKDNYLLLYEYNNTFDKTRWIIKRNKLIRETSNNKIDILEKNHFQKRRCSRVIKTTGYIILYPFKSIKNFIKYGVW
ncbi:MAG: hypothetical protein HYY40_04280 [Bacteroidetes bacterium]|nr:hypothetical protein [Bacteroidota bacterium]